MAEDDGSFDVAFNLQIEEALTASLLDNLTPPLEVEVEVEDDYLSQYEQFLLGHYKAEAEAKRMRLDLCHQVHDRAFASEILKVPDVEWAATGDHFHRPYGEGSSSSGGHGLEFRVYAKGLVEGSVGAIGVAICDESGCLIFEISKGLGVGGGGEFQAIQEWVEMKALIEGLDIAAVLGLKRLAIVTDSALLYRHITGKNQVMAANVVKLYEQINLLLRKFSQTQVSLETPENIKHAFELARNAIALQLNRSDGSSSTDNASESCAICLEFTNAKQMFQIPSCLHSYCTSCMMKHVEYKLLQGLLPKCPDVNCNTELKLDSCKKFLTPDLFEIMSQRVKEASIPVTEKIYCPNPRCSALLSKTELKGLPVEIDIIGGTLGGRKCPRCTSLFCIHCKVTWHEGMSCFDYKRFNPNPCKEDKKLESLANLNHWRQCPKCSHMVSLAAGCYHIYCRCGHEFCYTCGADWRNKKPTCLCPIWDERNIIESEH
ncbi:E3 ubiquitin-protein ligase RSL1-like [Andrographis paniculata]|uniref:E3 ubiquitin-protein ligase RSL1-like n=1 Tax=Andrographis paniculata TaxID=175694 RepID=UPI0021E92081|nr:E3 ubiquitin-protein ligase RSL1-like [Andrographis paniculata]